MTTNHGPGPSRPDGVPLRVVVADDVDEFRDLVALTLDGQDDLEVVAEVTTPDAVAAAVALHAPDAVVVGVRRPGVGTGAVVAATRAAGPCVALVVTSNWSSPAVSTEVVAAGADAYLERAVVVERVSEAVRRAVASRRRLADLAGVALLP